MSLFLVGFADTEGVGFITFGEDTEGVDFADTEGVGFITFGEDTEGVGFADTEGVSFSPSVKKPKV